MTKVLLICSSPMLSLRISMFLQDQQDIKFSIYRNLESALPLENDSDYDFVIVGAYMDQFDETAKVSDIKATWTGAQTKIILIADLDNPQQKICQRTVVNDVVYLFWHFQNRADIRRLIDDSLRPELNIENKLSPEVAIQTGEVSSEAAKVSARIHGSERSSPRARPDEGRPSQPILRSETSVSRSEATQRLEQAEIKLSNIERLKPPVVLIASSTGGFAALRRVVLALPQEFRSPVVIAQHMPKGFDETLVRSLNSANKNLTVVRASNQVLEARHIYVIPHDYHGILTEKGKTLHLTLNQDPKEHSLRPAADPLFRSVSTFQYFRVVAAILTGMGSDGSLGGKEIKKSGGIVLCQDQQSSAVWGMPRMAVETGICDKIVTLSNMSSTLFELTK